LDRPCSRAVSMCGRTALIRLARWTIRHTTIIEQTFEEGKIY
jgi:hypothetical protein